ncbi:unnamed protein product [Ixodes persulcatus]
MVVHLTSGYMISSVFSRRSQYSVNCQLPSGSIPRTMLHCRHQKTRRSSSLIKNALHRIQATETKINMDKKVKPLSPQRNKGPEATDKFKRTGSTKITKCSRGLKFALFYVRKCQMVAQALRQDGECANETGPKKYVTTAYDKFPEH